MSEPERKPSRYFMARRLISHEPPTAGAPKVRVRIELDCGCEVEREVDRSRLLEVEPDAAGASVIVPGKFVCGRHSFTA